MEERPPPLSVFFCARTVSKCMSQTCTLISTLLTSLSHFLLVLRLFNASRLVFHFTDSVFSCI